MSETVKQLFQQLTQLHADLTGATPVNRRETAAQRRERIKQLEAAPEEWIKYYFPKYAKASPAAFHIAATKRVLENPEWYEVRNWSRELAKSTRTMMEVFYLVLVGTFPPPRWAGQPSPLERKMWNELCNSENETSGMNNETDSNVPITGQRKKSNVLLISNSLDNAERLLLPYMVNMAQNSRIIHDYGKQQQIGNWTSSEFITRSGIAFRAVGAGQSPRGSRNEDVRPDIIIFDDLDTDADCHNPDIIQRRWEWVEQAVIPTRSISEPLLVMWCGNIIAEDCCVVRAQKLADHVDIVNIRDEHGKSTWPQKNSEADIERVLSKISYASQQKEYYNNPMSAGKTFPSVTWGTCPPLADMENVMVYADPAMSDKDSPGQTTKLTGSRKAVFIVGKKAEKYYIYKGYLDVMNQANFIRSIYAASDYIGSHPRVRYMIECNTTQIAFHDQVLTPRINEYGELYGSILCVQKDKRPKPDKWSRIEGLLEPLNRDGNLVFNIEEKDNPHMERLATQFIAATPASKQLDGPDCIEGAVFLLKSSPPIKKDDVYMAAPVSRFKY